MAFLTIYDAPYELPDAAIIHRLRPYLKFSGIAAAPSAHTTLSSMACVTFVFVFLIQSKFFAFWKIPYSFVP